MSSHCWKDRAEHAEEVYGWGSGPWAEAYSANGTCMLEAGHEGEHEFTADDQIGVVFAWEQAS